MNNWFATFMVINIYIGTLWGMFCLGVTHGNAAHYKPNWWKYIATFILNTIGYPICIFMAIVKHKKEMFIHEETEGQSDCDEKAAKIALNNHKRR